MSNRICYYCGHWMPDAGIDSTEAIFGRCVEGCGPRHFQEYAGTQPACPEFADFSVELENLKESAKANPTIYKVAQ
jgi:hypothetical protein